MAELDRTMTEFRGDPSRVDTWPDSRWVPPVRIESPGLASLLLRRLKTRGSNVARPITALHQTAADLLPGGPR